MSPKKSFRALLTTLALCLLAGLSIAAAPTADKRLYPSLREWSAAEAVAASTTGVHAAVTDTGAQQTITTNITDPPCPRSLSVTAGGTAGDIKAISVTISGTRRGKVITEAIGPFTVNTAGTVNGNKIFDHVDSIVIPAHDGTGATTSVGWDDKLGLPYALPYDTVLKVYKDGAAVSSTTVNTNASALESNYIDLSAALDGDPVSLVYLRF